MKRFFIALSIASLLLACSKEKEDKSKFDIESPGSRLFKIDNPSSSFVVNLSGANMGTPDSEAVSQVLEDAVSRGLVDQVTDLPAPIEGGIHTCLKITDVANREFVLDALQDVETSLTESNYLVESVDSCD